MDVMKQVHDKKCYW